MKLRKVIQTSTAFSILWATTFTLVMISVMASSETKVFLEPSSFTIATGSNFTVSVNIDNASNLYGFEFKLCYNTSILDAVEVVVSESFLNTPTMVVKNVVADSYNTTHGVVWLNVSSIAPALPASGNGTLALITFNATAEGDSVLHLFDTKLTDPDGELFFHSTADSFLESRNLLPEPYITHPSNDDTLSGNVTIFRGNVTHIRAVEMNSASDIISTLFEWSADRKNWSMIGINDTGSLGTWSINWNTTELAEGMYHIRATMTDSIGQQGYYEKSAYYDPTPPRSEIYQPTDREEIRGLVTFRTNITASDILYMRLEYLNSSRSDVDQDQLGKLEQGDVGPDGADGANHFCAPTATANALWRIVTKLREKTKELIEIKKDKEGEYLKWFNEHMKTFKGNKLTSYYEEKGGKKYLTLLGLAVVLAKKMGTNKDTGTTTWGVNDGLKKFLKEQCAEKKYTLTPGNYTPHTRIRGHRPRKVGDTLEQWYDSGGILTRQKFIWDGKKWKLTEWYGPCTQKNKDDYMINLKNGEAVIILIKEVDNGPDGKVNTPDDKTKGAGHFITGKDFHIKKQGDTASFIDDGKEFTSEWKYVKGKDEKGVHKEFIEIKKGDKWYRITWIGFVSAKEKKYKEDLGVSYTPIGDDYLAYDGWSVPWDTFTVPEGFYIAKATIVDVNGNIGTDYITVFVKKPVGGIVVQVDKLALLATWIFLAVSVAVAAVSVIVYRKKYSGF